MKFEFDPVILFPDIWLKTHLFQIYNSILLKKGAFLYFSNIEKMHLFVFTSKFQITYSST